MRFITGPEVLITWGDYIIVYYVTELKSTNIQVSRVDLSSSLRRNLIFFCIYIYSSTFQFRLYSPIPYAPGITNFFPLMSSRRRTLDKNVVFCGAKRNSHNASRYISQFNYYNLYHQHRSHDDCRAWQRGITKPLQAAA